jgi:hypothetical protein
MPLYVLFASIDVAQRLGSMYLLHMEKARALRLLLPWNVWYCVYLAILLGTMYAWESCGARTRVECPDWDWRFSLEWNCRACGTVPSAGGNDTLACLKPACGRRSEEMRLLLVEVLGLHATEAPKVYDPRYQTVWQSPVRPPNPDPNPNPNPRSMTRGTRQCGSRRCARRRTLAGSPAHGMATHAGCCVPLTQCP